MTRLPIVGVMGSGTEAHEARSSVLGRWLAQQGVHLLTGGGGGVMTSVARAFHGEPGRRGMVIGVLPAIEHAEGYPNDWIEIAIRTHLPLRGERGDLPMSRNHINVLSSAVVLALPGGSGTVSEVRLALRYRRPVAAFVDARSDIPGLPAEVPVLITLEAVAGFVGKALG